MSHHQHISDGRLDNTGGGLQESLNAAEHLTGGGTADTTIPCRVAIFGFSASPPKSPTQPVVLRQSASKSTSYFITRSRPAAARKATFLPHLPVSCDGIGSRIRMFNSWLDGCPARTRLGGCPAGQDGCQRGVGNCTYSSSSMRDYKISTATPPARRTGCSGSIANAVAARRRPDVPIVSRA